MNEVNETQRRPKVITVSLYPEQLAILDQLSRDSGIENISAAVRFVVNDYARRTPTAAPSEVQS